MFKILSLILLSSLALNAHVNVMVTDDTEINNTSKQELSNLYLKKTTELKGKKVTVINNKKNYDEFNKKVLNKTPSQIHAYWMKQIFLGKKVPPKNIEQESLKGEISNKKNTIIYSSEKLDKKVIYETH